MGYTLYGPWEEDGIWWVKILDPDKVPICVVGSSNEDDVMSDAEALLSHLNR